MGGGNKTGLLLDVLDAAHQPQGLGLYAWRQVRRVRRVDLHFVTALLRIPSPRLNNICAWKFSDFL
jgi:hypothetical protein